MLVILLTMLPMGGVELPDFVYRALPVPVVLLGALICFYGRKARRLYALTLGVTVGTIVIHEVLPSNTSGLGSTWALVFLCALGIAIAGVLCVLIRQVAAGAALGAILGLLAAIGAHRLHFGWVRDEFLVVLDVVFIVVLTLVAVGKPTSTMMASSAMSGSLAIVAAADHFMSGRFLAYVAHLVRDGMQSDDFGGASFAPAMIAWFVLALLGVFTQHFVLAADVDRSALRAKPIAYKEDKLFIKRSTSMANLGGAGTPRASHNYFEDHDPPASVVAINDLVLNVFADVANWFGFQTDNRDNQREHVMYLLAAIHTQGHSDFVQRLHDKIFANYLYWCARMKVRPALRWQGCRHGPPEMWDLALYMCVWGEASNLRHCPELLCFLFHQMSSAAQGGTMLVGGAPPQSPPGTYLASVVRPIYDVIVSQPKADHAGRLIYDDINEFFWNKECLKYHYAAHSAHMSQVRRSTMPSIAEGLQHARKTYVERRSWLHPLKSFHRVFAFLAITFHLLTCVAFLEYAGAHPSSALVLRVLGSVLLTMSLTSLLGELLYLWSLGGMDLQTNMQSFGCFLRLFVKTGAFITLTLYYVWSFTSEFGPDKAARSWEIFQTAAILYLVPWLLTLTPQLVPALGEYFYRMSPLRPYTSIWWPSQDLYVGHGMAEHERECFKYQVFWVTLLAWKFACSYFFQIRPLIHPTMELLRNKTHQNVLFPYSQYVLLVMLWLPFLFVFAIDLSVWYAIWTAAVGAFVGVSQKLGEIRYFSMIQARFMTLAAEFERKVINRGLQVRVDVGQRTGGREAPARAAGGLRRAHSRLQSTTTGSSDLTAPLLPKQAADRAHPAAPIVISSDGAPTDDNVLSSDKWHRFADAWAAFVADMRTRDLVSNAERDTLVFRDQDGVLRLPLFLCAGALDNVLQIAVELDAERRADGSGTSAHYELILGHRIADDAPMSDAIAQVWTAVQWILRTLLGDRHDRDVSTFLDYVLVCVRRQCVLEFYDVRRLSSLKDALLDLVRLLSVASKQRKQAPSSGAGTGLAAPGDAEGQPATTSSAAAAAASSAASGAGRMLTGRATTTTQAIKREQSSGMLMMMDKLHTQAPLPNGEIRVLRLQVRALLDVIKGCSSRPDVIDSINKIVSKADGFFHDEEYTMVRVTTLLAEPRAPSEIASLYTLLTLAAIDARPKSNEARRRMQYFVNSLYMDMPAAPRLSAMHSFSILTPFYSEDVIYSRAELLKETEDGVSPLLYLKTIFSDEWHNFCERVGADPLDTDVLDTDKGHQVQLWATNRGQTLFRTVSGMMCHETALQVLSKLEDPDIEADEQASLVLQKFTYVVTCQRYGWQKRTGDPRASDIDYMLAKYPNLRVAYIDTVQVAVKDDQQGSVEVEEHFSVLIKSVRVGGTDLIQEVYRIKLPGNPIVGEGKPENQNHAIIFTRGEMVQTIDMNQDAYFEEALKMRNLLQEFDGGSPDRPVTIVGFAEHIFTSRLSSIANYMALQEGVFVTLGQRVLANPLRIRMHYGHPDLFDKTFHLTRGGISKASRGINLSEDIFAGYNTTLRGGSVIFREFMEVGKGRDVGLQQLTTFEAKLSQGAAEQSFSRDVARLADSFDFFRLMSFYAGGLGFYFNNSFTIWAVFIFLHSKLLWSLFGFSFMDNFSGVASGAYWFGMVGFLTTLPILATLGVIRGFRTAAVLTMQMLLTGGPLFFCFAMATKAHYFERTVLAGGAKYRPTGRGFITKHEHFAEIYRFHASSHFSKALELFLGLLLYQHFTSAPGTYWSSTWPIWMLALSWSFAPFWFNPMAFEWEKTISDGADFFRWMHRKEGNSGQSWQAWFDDENAWQKCLDWRSRLVICVLKLRYVLIGVGLLSNAESTLLSIVSGVIAVVLSIALPFIFRCHRHSQRQCVGRSINALLSLTLFVAPIAVVIWWHVQWSSVNASIQTVLGVVFIVSAVVSVLLVNGARWPILQQLCKLYHYALSLLLLVPVLVLALCYFPAYIQTRLTFHNAFSKGVVIDDLLRGSRKGRRQQSVEAMSQIRTHLEKQQRQIDDMLLSKKPAVVGVAAAADKGNDTRPIPVTVSAADYAQQQQQQGVTTM